MNMNKCPHCGQPKKVITAWCPKCGLLDSHDYDLDDAFDEELMNEFLNADDLQAILQAENVLARRYFSPPCHLTPPYSAGHLPMTEMVARRVLVLPTGTAVHEDDIIKICDIIRYVADNAEELLPAVRGRE